jgi:hypothetical protein
MFTPEEKRSLFGNSAMLALGSSAILAIVADVSSGISCLLVWAIILPTFYKYIDR